jgi:hypothetical protein
VISADRDLQHKHILLHAFVFKSPIKSIGQNSGDLKLDLYLLSLKYLFNSGLIQNTFDSLDFWLGYVSLRIFNFQNQKRSQVHILKVYINVNRASKNPCHRLLYDIDDNLFQLVWICQNVGWHIFLKLSLYVDVLFLQLIFGDLNHFLYLRLHIRNLIIRFE